MRENRRSADALRADRRDPPAPPASSARAAHYPGMPLRCKRYIASALALLLAAWMIPTLAMADDAVHVSLRPATGASAPKIGIDGTTPIGCVPKIEQVHVDGADLSIALSAAQTGCKAQRLPFHLTVDPAAASGASALPPDVYRVRVYTGSGTGAHLAAFALLDTTAASAAPLPETGFWWTQASPDVSAARGTGMSLELQDNQLAASLLGFDATGTPTWYFGSAGLNGRVAHVSLVQLGRGEDWFSAIGSQPEVEPGPSLDIDFLSPTRADAYLVRTGDDGTLQVRALVLSRSAFASGPTGLAWAGRWVLVPEDGAGTRVFDFAAPSSRDAQSFRLIDTANDAMLDCRLAAGTQQADVCTLTSAATVVADFDQVGFDRFAGHDANGMPVQMLRVPH